MCQSLACSCCGVKVIGTTAATHTRRLLARAWVETETEAGAGGAGALDGSKQPSRESARHQAPFVLLEDSVTCPSARRYSLYGVPVCMEVDTGTAISWLSWKVQQQFFPVQHLKKPSVQLTTYACGTRERSYLAGTIGLAEPGDSV